MQSVMTRNQTTGKRMRITSRVVNARRHTTGYVIGGREYSVMEARRLAENGGLNGVQIVGKHLQACPGSRRLSDLPTRIKK